MLEIEKTMQWAENNRDFNMHSARAQTAVAHWLCNTLSIWGVGGRERSRPELIIVYCLCTYSKHCLCDPGAAEECGMKFARCFASFLTPRLPCFQPEQLRGSLSPVWLLLPLLCTRTRKHTTALSVPLPHSHQSELSKNRMNLFAGVGWGPAASQVPFSLVSRGEREGLWSWNTGWTKSTQQTHTEEKNWTALCCDQSKAKRQRGI